MTLHCARLRAGYGLRWPHMGRFRHSMTLGPMAGLSLTPDARRLVRPVNIALRLGRLKTDWFWRAIME